MKKYLLSICLVIIVSFVYSQSGMVSTGIGYNASFVNPKAANVVIDRYNETRPWLTEEMNHIRFMDGLSWNGTATIGFILFDLNYNRRVAVVSAKGDSGYGMMQRDIKIKDGSFGIGLGINVIESNPTIGLGFDADFGLLTFKSRSYYTESSDKGEFEEFESSLSSGGTIWLQFMFGSESEGIGLAFRPYYHFDFLPYNYEWFNEGINPDTYYYDRYDQTGKSNHVGIQLLINYYTKDL